LISVSVAPVSYFFCAEAAETDSAIASAVPVTRWRIPFLISLISSCVVIEPMISSGRSRVPSLARILAERMLHCKVAMC
jgi:hypothetical protein